MKQYDFPTSIIMDIPFSKLSFKETEQYLVQRIEDKQFTHVVTANPEIVMFADTSGDYKQTVLAADIVVPDGIGIVYASRLRKDPVTERVAGYDLLHRLMYHSDLHKWKVFLLGASEEVNRLTYERLQQDYPNADLVGRHHGYFQDNTIEEQQLVEQIAELKPDIIFVAMGFPRQELWINRHKGLLQTPLMMGVGGSFDILSGKVKRAPALWQRLGLEWLHRLISTPSRWRRMLVLPKFLLKEIKTSRFK